jgi:hypothetical protein
MATIKYQEDAQGNKKIIVKTDPETDQQKVSCGCCDGCGLEVRSVTAYLSHVGYLPFTCEGSEPPPTDTRYLKYRASGDGYIEACGVAPQHQNVTQEWEVDPFTGLTCYNGLHSEIISNGCSDLFDCSQTQKFYSCALNANDPCTSAQEDGEINWTESLQDPYTIEDVASNVDTVLGRINPYGNDGMPAGTRGSVVNGTNGSILTWVNACALNRAEYISGAGEVAKTKLFVKFTKDTQYTLTQSYGSVQTLNATEGQQITVDPPATPNTWTTIAIVNPTKAGCCNSSIVATTHTGQTTDSTFVPDEDAPPPPTTFIGPDCKKYLTKYTTNSSSYTESGEGASNETFSDVSTNNSEYEYTIEESYGSTSTINAGQEPSVTESYTITTSKTTIDTNTTYSYSEELEEYYKSNEYTSTANCTSSNNATGGTSSTTTTTTQDTIFYEDGSFDSGDEQTSTSSGNEVCASSDVIWGIVPSNIASCPNYEWDDSWSDYVVGNTTYNRNVSHSKKTEISGAVDSSTITVNKNATGTISAESSDSGENYNSTASNYGSGIQGDTIVTTYSNPYLGPDYPGTWEVETSPNESLCAMRTESETTKQSKNVAASVELTFTAPASESPITYEHWFHYYTVEVDSSEQGCPTSDIVAHNEKWTSVSSGGVLTLSRNINLSTPPKDHSICAQSLAFVTRVAS